MAGNAKDGDIGGLDEIKEEFEPIRGIRPCRAVHGQACGICQETILPGYEIIKVQRYGWAMQVAAAEKSWMEDPSGWSARTSRARVPAAVAAAEAP